MCVVLIFPNSYLENALTAPFQRKRRTTWPSRCGCLHSGHGAHRCPAPPAANSAAIAGGGSTCSCICMIAAMQASQQRAWPQRANTSVISLIWRQTAQRFRMTAVVWRRRRRPSPGPCAGTITLPLRLHARRTRWASVSLAARCLNISILSSK